MDFDVQADLIPLFRGLVTGLKPYAEAQDVGLEFRADAKELNAYYNPQKVLSEITVLLSRVITFTPQGFQIDVSLVQSLESGNKCFLQVENTGVNLSKLGEIISSVSHGLSIEELPKGTRFKIEIPVAQNNFPLSSGQKK